MTARRLSRVTWTLAVSLLYGLIAFSCLNLVLYLLYRVKDRVSPESIPASLRKYTLSSLQPLYPGMGEAEIDQLLRETWSRHYTYEPFTQYKESPFVGRYVNVSADGYRLSEGQGPWPPPSGARVVFVFGASTAFGYGLPDGQTIPSYLQAALSGQPGAGATYVYNFGRGGYYSTQEVILFQKLLSAGFRPDVAVFLDGISDFSHHEDRPQYTASLERYFADPTRVVLPLNRLLDSMRAVVRRRRRAVGVGLLDDPHYQDASINSAVIDRYLRNKRLAETAASAFAVDTLFVWQPTPVYRYDLSRHFFAADMPAKHVYARSGYDAMRAVMARDSTPDFLWCADIQEDLREPLYVDVVHYDAKLSKMTADEIATAIHTQSENPSEVQ